MFIQECLIYTCSLTKIHAGIKKETVLYIKSKCSLYACNYITNDMHDVMVFQIYLLCNIYSFPGRN